jgi:hypothetical protein
MTGPEKSKRTGGTTRGAGSRVVLPVGTTRRIELTDRDLDILTWVTRHGVVTIEQITRKFFPGSAGFSAAQRRIRKLGEVHPPVIRRDRTFWRYPTVVRVTASGANLAGINLRPARLVLAEIKHSLGIVDLTERLLDEHPGATLVTERERRAERYRSKFDGTRKATGRIPDGVLILKGSQGKEVAIELDLSHRREKTVEAIIKAYNAERYDAVWWYVLPGREERITEIVRRKKVADFIEVRTWRD